MKNPMTLQEQHQALDDNAAGYNMQFKKLYPGSEWRDRTDIGEPLNFYENEYRRKPEPEETNPWRKIVKGEWPECKPDDEIQIIYPNGVISQYPAGEINWHSTRAIEWKFAEDEQ